MKTNSNDRLLSSSGVSPTMIVERNGNLIFNLDRKQMCCLLCAGIPNDSTEAKLGRQILAEMNRYYIAQCEAHPNCVITILPRKLDGEPA